MDASLVPDIGHYGRVIWHRKWWAVNAFVVIAAATFIVAKQLPDIYTSETLILVDPQKVPEDYVKSTVTGDVRNRLGTLSQQILSVTRLQKIIERLNLYPEERKTKSREELILTMRGDINVKLVTDIGNGQDLEAFRISYSGRDPRLVAQVTNELASSFIDENLKSREQQATGTTDFLHNQLEETRKALEEQEALLKDFKLKHVGEMPESEAANVQILGQLQGQLQLESEALARAEQQRAYLESLAAQSAPVVDIDDERVPAAPTAKAAEVTGKQVNPLADARARLAALLERYTPDHPDVVKLKHEIADLEAKGGGAAAPPLLASSPAPPPDKPAPARRIPIPANTVNPVLRSQMASLDAEIEKHRAEVQRVSKMVNGYRAKLEAIPVREQEIVQLVRDYEINKTHYSQLLEKQLSAETATQLEIRQKGEKFTVLDPAQVAERPSRPNRLLINAAGSGSGLVIGILLALCTEFLGLSVTGPAQLAELTRVPVLEVIPRIKTEVDRRMFRRRLIWAASGLATALLGVMVVVYRFRTVLF